MNESSSKRSKGLDGCNSCSGWTVRTEKARPSVEFVGSRHAEDPYTRPVTFHEVVAAARSSKPLTTENLLCKSELRCFRKMSQSTRARNSAHKGTTNIL